MIAYKGFNKDMTCRGFQYEEGKEYETDSAKLCESGFHACENPLDCFRYYAPGQSVYHKVELDDNGERNDDDTKVVGKKIKIGAEIGLKGIIEAGVKLIYEKAIKEKSASSGFNSKAEAKGKHCAAAALGKNVKVRASIGGGICATEYGDWDGKGYPLLAIKAAIVDGEIIKADTWYKLENGDFVEVEDE